jgi:2-phosphosulfolactate phosphatase
MTFLDQRSVACRCEWGINSLESLAPSEVIIVVDVLSFSTCVDVAVSRGAVILPYPWKDESARQFAAVHDAELAGARGKTRFSLSPVSFAEVETNFRCVLPSPNGAALALRAASKSGVVLAGCLRNAAAVAEVAASLGSTFSVCPAGERWPDDSLRPAVEDWLGAGAILRLLPGTKSPEARAAIATFEAAHGDLREVIRTSSSGRELIERGYGSDVEFAADWDISSAVPRLERGAFTAFRKQAV